MTKKHFIALADKIRGMYECGEITFKGIEDLAEFCQEQNSLFNRNRWISYIKGECGKNGGKVK